jgi:hypothetical protein
MRGAAISYLPILTPMYEHGCNFLALILSITLRAPNAAKLLREPPNDSTLHFRGFFKRSSC